LCDTVVFQMSKDAVPEKPDEQAQTESEKITDEFAIKHPLQHAWVLWYDGGAAKKITAQTWGDNLKKVYTFSTVEDFWSLWNNIKAAGDLPAGSNYHIFKIGVEPKWEDKANSHGGKWLATVKNNQRGTSLNQMWLGVVLAAIGCAFDYDEEVNGLVVSIRKGLDKIALWTKTGDKEEVCKRIGVQFREFLGLPSTITLGFQLHSDALASNSKNSITNKVKFFDPNILTQLCFREQSRQKRKHLMILKLI